MDEMRRRSFTQPINEELTEDQAIHAELADEIAQRESGGRATVLRHHIVRTLGKRAGAIMVEWTEGP